MTDKLECPNCGGKAEMRVVRTFTRSQLEAELEAELDRAELEGGQWHVGYQRAMDKLIEELEPKP